MLFLLLIFFSFLAVFHVSIHSSVLPLYLPRCHANIALYRLRDEKPLAREHLMANAASCQHSCLFSGLGLTPLVAGVKQRDLRVAHGVAVASSLPK